MLAPGSPSRMLCAEFVRFCRKRDRSSQPTLNGAPVRDTDGGGAGVFVAPGERGVRVGVGGANGMTSILQASRRLAIRRRGRWRFDNGLVRVFSFGGLVCVLFIPRRGNGRVDLVRVRDGMRFQFEHLGCGQEVTGFAFHKGIRQGSQEGDHFNRKAF